MQRRKRITVQPLFEKGGMLGLKQLMQQFIMLSALLGHVVCARGF